MSRRTMAVVAIVVGVILLIGGFYEWSQKVTCGPGSSARCTAGKHRHPSRAYALWAAGGVLLVVGVGLGVADRRR